MSGAETTRRPVAQRRIGGAEMALPRSLYPMIFPSIIDFGLRGRFWIEDVALFLWRFHFYLLRKRRFNKHLKPPCS